MIDCVSSSNILNTSTFQMQKLQNISELIILFDL